jgi:hypothetical protein
MPLACYTPRFHARRGFPLDNSLLTGDISMSMGGRAIWALLWVIGIPLPVLLILYLITGGGCG